VVALAPAGAAMRPALVYFPGGPAAAPVAGPCLSRGGSHAAPRLPGSGPGGGAGGHGLQPQLLRRQTGGKRRAAMLRRSGPVLRRCPGGCCGPGACRTGSGSGVCCSRSGGPRLLQRSLTFLWLRAFSPCGMKARGQTHFYPYTRHIFPPGCGGAPPAPRISVASPLSVRILLVRPRSRDPASWNRGQALRSCRGCFPSIRSLNARLRGPRADAALAARHGFMERAAERRPFHAAAYPWSGIAAGGRCPRDRLPPP